MPPITRLLAIGLGLSALLLSPIASAKGQLSLGIGVQGHLWEEYISGTNNKLLDESGARYTMNLSYDTYNSREDGLVYGLDMLGFIGELDYDGNLIDGATAANSSTIYLGSDIRITLGNRSISSTSRWSFDWLGGLGYSAWGRKIDDGRDINGNPFSGYTENYSVFYGHLGAGLFRQGEKWDQYLQFGFKHPIDITEQVEEPFDVELEPGADTAFYFNWNFYRKDKNGMRDYAVTLYIDSFRFSSSSAVPTNFDVNGNTLPDDLVYQPESDYNTFGIRLIRYFR